MLQSNLLQLIEGPEASHEDRDAKAIQRLVFVYWKFGAFDHGRGHHEQQRPA
jgi:hypothetical protein